LSLSLQAVAQATWQSPPEHLAAPFHSMARRVDAVDSRLRQLERAHGVHMLEGHDRIGQGEAPVPIEGMNPPSGDAVFHQDGQIIEDASRELGVGEGEAQIGLGGTPNSAAEYGR
jgi:hypothetical protein